MYDLKLTCLCLLPSIGAMALSSPDTQLQSLHSNELAYTPVSLRSIPELQKRCTGDCVTCFGQGYQECSSDSTICYKPGDSVHGEESCSGTSYNIPSVPTFDFCNDGSCATCFGEGFQNCPDSTVSCYKPGDSTYGLESACSSSSDTSSGTVSSSLPSSSSAAATASSSQPTSSPSTSDGYNVTSTDFCNNGGFDCKRCFGSTYIPCPESSAYASQSYCYDPNNSTSICPDGTQPAAGSGSGSTGSGTSGSGSSSSGDSDNVSASSSASYTASAPSETVDTATQVTSSDSTSETTSAAGGSSSDEDTSSTASTTFTSSRTISATSGSQTSSSSSGDPNGDPISASSSGQSSVRQGVFGALVASLVCLGASAWFAL